MITAMRKREKKLFFIRITVRPSTKIGLAQPQTQYEVVLNVSELRIVPYVLQKSHKVLIVSLAIAAAAVFTRNLSDYQKFWLPKSRAISNSSSKEKFIGSRKLVAKIVKCWQHQSF